MTEGATKFDPKTVEWQARPEDTIGGWCCTPLSDPRSPAAGGVVILECSSEEMAKHIAHVHNTWLEDGDSWR